MNQTEDNRSLNENEITQISKRLVSTLIPNVAKSVKLSHEFPTTATPAFTYYNDFPQYKAVMNGNSNKILSLIQNIIDEVKGEGNVLDIPQPKSLEEKFAAIVDVNDRVLDRLTLDMDIETNPNRANNNTQNLVVASQGIALSSPQGFNEKLTVLDRRKSQIGSRNSAVKLLTAKNIARPQVLFTHPPDNSSTPFAPSLKIKPNAILPLKECNPTADPDTGDYAHPYFTELEEFAKTIQKFKYTPSPNPIPALLSDTVLVFVDSKAALNNMIAELKLETIIAVDLEHHNYRTFLGITCLMQLSSRKKDYIVDTIALRDDLVDLNELFTDPKIEKVLHGADCDLMWLQRDCGVYVVNLFDTGQAARALHLPRFSLSYLLQNFAGTTTDKTYQLADWRIRPLPEELIEYARSDTHYLLYIAEQLRCHLADRGLLTTVLETSREMCLRLYKKPVFDPLGYLDIYHTSVGIGSNKRQLYALKHLYALRDSIARREDESLQYVLPKHMLKVIAEELPRETTGVFACCSPIPPLVRKYVYDIHKIILDARNSQLGDLVVDDLADELNNKSIKQGFGGAFEMQSVRAPPHDFSSTRSRRPGPFGPAHYPHMNKIAWNKPSSMGRSFARHANSYRKPNNTYVDPSRGMLHKLLDLFQNVPVTDSASALVDESVMHSSPVKPHEDPLYCPPPKLEEKSHTITPEEVIQLAELGESFRPTTNARWNAQSRVANNRKNRRQQQQQGSGTPPVGRQSWKGEKRAPRDSDPRPPAKRHSDPKRESVSDESDEMEIVVIRDTKLRNQPFDSVKKRNKKAPLQSPNQSEGRRSVSDNSLISSPAIPNRDTLMPHIPANILPPIQKPPRSNNRRRRGRGRGNENRKSFGGIQSKQNSLMKPSA